MIRLIPPKSLMITDDPSVCWSHKFVRDELRPNLQRQSVIEIQAAFLSDAEVRIGADHDLEEFLFIPELAKSKLGQLFWVKAAFQQFSANFPRNRIGVFAPTGNLRAGDCHEELVAYNGHSFYVGVARITLDNFFECVTVAGDNLRTFFVFANYRSSQEVWRALADRILEHFRFNKTITIDTPGLFAMSVDPHHALARFGRGPFDRYLNFNLYVHNNVVPEWLAVLNRTTTSGS
jgi:hypothetical protein